MAVDHALLEQVQRDRTPVLRLYRWQPACLSFGRNQPTLGIYHPDNIKVDTVRRPTGGMAVLHDCELTYAFVAPAPLLGGPRQTYFNVNRALVAGLKRLGVSAQLANGHRRSPFGTVHPCFAEPACGEVVVENAKLVGSAQRAEKNTLLQHGSILIDGEQLGVTAIATLKSVLGSAPELAHITTAIAAGFEEVCGIPLAPSEMFRSTAERAEELDALYRSTEWTWRR
jgi:lipoyl(octanoyl) transferase